MIDMTSLSLDRVPFFADLFGDAYSNGSMTIEPVVLRPPMNLCAAAASRSGEGFHNVARYHSLCDGLEQRFCSSVDFASVRHVMRKRGTGDEERPANAQIFDEVDRIRNA